MPADNIVGLSELIESVNKFYHDRRNEIHKSSEGTYAYLINVLRSNDDTLETAKSELCSPNLAVCCSANIDGARIRIYRNGAGFSWVLIDEN